MGKKIKKERSEGVEDSVVEIDKKQRKLIYKESKRNGCLECQGKYK